MVDWFCFVRLVKQLNVSVGEPNYAMEEVVVGLFDWLR